MRMRQFLIALAAAVLLAGLAVPAAGKKPPRPPPTPVGEIGEPVFELTDQGPPVREDWGVRAKVVVTSNVESVLEHSLIAGEFEPPIEAADEVRLRKTGGTEVRLVVGPPPYECPATYSVTYDAVLRTEDGVVLDSLGPVVSEDTFTCPYEGPFPGLDYGTERSGKYWTATVVAAAWAFYPDVDGFEMFGRFTPGFVEEKTCAPLPEAPEDPEAPEGLGDPEDQSRRPWLCTWTSGEFDRKAVESVTFEVTGFEPPYNSELPLPPYNPELPCSTGPIYPGGGDGRICPPPP